MIYFYIASLHQQQNSILLPNNWPRGGDDDDEDDGQKWGSEGDRSGQTIPGEGGEVDVPGLVPHLQQLL